MPKHETEANMHAFIDGIPKADLQSDVHVKPDAASISYRRWLKELGLSTGTL